MIALVCALYQIGYIYATVGPIRVSMEKLKTKSKIEQILDRGVIVNILPSPDEFKKTLLSGRKLRMYIGADPTSPSLHLSHAKNYMLLEEFRQLGHEVIVLFGDFTARIGDPSDRDAVRKALSEKEVMENVKAWKKQIERVLSLNDKKNPVEILHNSKWLSKLSLDEVMSLSSQFTVSHMLERDMFEKRLRENKPIFLNEFLYPLMQGYDSVAMDVDVEIGGTDQIFNMLAGRTLQKRLNKKEKYLLVVNLLENPKTHELMSKSAGRGVFLDTTPEDMYGQIMAEPDEMIEPLYINCTRVPLAEIEELLKSSPPKEAKMSLASEIVTIFHGNDSAKKAGEEFTSAFSRGEIPAEAKTVKARKGDMLVDKLIGANAISSKSEFRRLIRDNGIHNLTQGCEVTEENAVVSKSIDVRVGKRRFIKIVVN
jgi:tyrosyl-tRNA synthetase